MNKFFTTILVIIFASAVGWYFMPEGWRGKISSAASIALRGDKQEIKKFIGKTVLPEDPEKRRTVLLGELKKSLAEVKKGGADGLTSQNFLGTVEEIVKDLEEANHDKSIIQKITERVVDKVFPVKNEAAQCKK